MDEFECLYFSGGRLFGDDFNDNQIREWYIQEEFGYFDLVQGAPSFEYVYHELNRFHAYRFLQGPYECCLALGAARGDDISPLADRVGRYVVIEPAVGWWSDQIGGVPAQYIKPTTRGEIGFEDGSFDLAVCLGVLHHIPNVTFVLSELARTLRRGALLVIREPISTMGDWRHPRRGLTRNERGLPPHWLEAQAERCGLRLRRHAYCLFPTTLRLAKYVRRRSFADAALIRFDAMLSWAFSWNLKYHRNTFFKKLAPGAVYCLFEKQ